MATARLVTPPAPEKVIELTMSIKEARELIASLDLLIMNSGSIAVYRAVINALDRV